MKNIVFSLLFPFEKEKISPLPPKRHRTNKNFLLYSQNWPFNFNVNWDSQSSRADQETPLRTEWRTYDSKVAHANNFEKSYDKSYDCQHERRNPNHRPRNRRKTIVNEEMDYGVMDTTHEFNYYKPYSYYEPS